MMDNYDLWEAAEKRAYKKVRRRPHCEICDEPIQQDDAVFIGGDWYCDECLHDSRRWIEEEDEE